MNEVMQIRAASWAAMIKQRNDSGLSIPGDFTPRFRKMGTGIPE